ncbi:Polyprotein [Arachis hypogaea]|uniref:Polyprotein n=1 Tax=Arachis hypogaea TaxID=3818 RepID=A0A6B9V4K9_ARAHY|nr:Polyprotein [Arachis hypogaea]
MTSKGVTPQGYQSTIPQEKVLNWQTENAVSQNKVLLRIDHTLEKLVDKTDKLPTQVYSVQAQVNELKECLTRQAQQLDQDLKTYIQIRYFGPEFHKKDQELTRIKAQLKQIEEDRARQSKPQALAIDPLSIDFTKKGKSHRPTHRSPIKGSHEPRPRSPWTTADFFRGEASGEKPSKTSAKEKEIKEGSPTPGRIIGMLSAHTAMDDIFTGDTSDTSDLLDSFDDSTEEDHMADLSAIAMVNSVLEEQDRGEVSEIDTRMAAPNTCIQQVLFEFVTRMTGNLREWINTLSEYERLQLINGSAVQKDLEAHYKKMAAKYYPLRGQSNPLLKQVFLASLPEELQPEIQRMMVTLRKEISTTLGKIYQLALAALDKLCEQQQMIKQLTKNSPVLCKVSLAMLR